MALLVMLKEFKKVLDRTVTKVLRAKTPCLPRAHEWFIKHWDKIISEADKAVVPLPGSTYGSARGLMLLRVVEAYETAAKAETNMVTFYHGCTCGTDACEVGAYMKALFVAIRALVKAEEEARWPRDY